MTTTTTYKTGQEIHALVKVAKITSFWRYNRWSNRRELCCCITMQADNDVLVTFTNQASKFAQLVGDPNIGEINIVGKFKRMQEYKGQVQIVLTYVKRV